MNEVRERKKQRRDMQAVMAATLFILLALAVLMVAVFDQGWLAGISVVLIGLGVVMLATSFIAPGPDSFGPTSSDVRLVWGVLLAMFGAIGLVHEYVSSEWWVAAVLVLLTIGILILVMTMKGMLKRR